VKLTIKYPFLPKARSLGTGLVMDTFGVDFDQGEHVVCDALELPIEPKQVVLFTGPSGSGKSSLLRAVARQLEHEGHQLLEIDRLTLPDLPLVDALPVPTREALDLLTACGLSEAQLLLRTPGELSDGQRYRFRLALALATLRHDDLSLPTGERGAKWFVADEFTAVLDRTLAQVLAYNLARLARRYGLGCLLATTQEDVAVDLAPDLHVRPELDGRIGVERRDGPARKRVSFFPAVGTVRAPVPTGPASPAGITAAMRSASSARSRCSGMRIGRSASASSPPPPAACGSGISSSDCTTRTTASR
jgi:energy-coupling factor transporter ATP-binding protein EcfA2